MTEEEIDSFDVGDIVIVTYPDGKELEGIIVDRDGFCTFYLNYGSDKNYPVSFCSHKVRHKEAIQ